MLDRQARFHRFSTMTKQDLSGGLPKRELSGGVVAVAKGSRRERSTIRHFSMLERWQKAALYR